MPGTWEAETESVRPSFARLPLVALGVVAMAVGFGGTVAQAAPASVLQVQRTRTNELIAQVNADRSTFAGISFDDSAGVATVRLACGHGMLSVIGIVW